MSSLPTPAGALASLDDSLALPFESLEVLKAVRSIDAEAVIKQLSVAAESNRKLRSLVASVVPQVSWQTREELDALLTEIPRILATRDRLQAVATELESGSIVHRRALRVGELNQLREQAIIELRSHAKSGEEPPTLPGPEADHWMEWAGRLKEPEDAEALQSLRSGFAALDDFVANLEPGMWMAKNPTGAPLPHRAEPENVIQDVREQLRSRLLTLATELERGNIRHHRVLRVNQLNRLRQQAICELRSHTECEAVPPNLPGPEAERWIEWACGLREPKDVEVLKSLREDFASLDEFVANLELEMWNAGGSGVVEAQPKTEETVEREPGKQCQLETDRLQEAAEPAQDTGIKSNTIKSSEHDEQLSGPQRRDEVSELVLETDKCTPSVASPRTEEKVQPAALKATAAAPAIRFEIITRIENAVRKIGRMPLVIIATVIVLAGVGAVQWRSHWHLTIPIKGLKSKTADITRSDPQNSSSYQSQMSTASETPTSNSIRPTEQQSKPEDRSVALKTVPTSAPGNQAVTQDDAALKPPAITLSNDIANRSNASPKAPIQVTDPIPPRLQDPAPNSMAGILKDDPSAQLKLAAQKLRYSPGGAQGLVIRQVAPLYPAAARQARIQGTVVLQAVIGKDGSVLNVRVLSGHPLLIQAAEIAVKQWHFNPYYHEGEPVEADTQINVKFTLND